MTWYYSFVEAFFLMKKKNPDSGMNRKSRARDLLLLCFCLPVL